MHACTLSCHKGSEEKGWAGCVSVLWGAVWACHEPQHPQSNTVTFLLYVVTCCGLCTGCICSCYLWLSPIFSFLSLRDRHKMLDSNWADRQIKERLPIDRFLHFQPHQGTVCSGAHQQWRWMVLTWIQLHWAVWPRLPSGVSCLHVNNTTSPLFEDI